MNWQNYAVNVQFHYLYWCVQEQCSVMSFHVLACTLHIIAFSLDNSIVLLYFVIICPWGAAASWISVTFLSICKFFRAVLLNCHMSEVHHVYHCDFKVNKVVEVVNIHLKVECEHMLLRACRFIRVDVHVSDSLLNKPTLFLSLIRVS